MNSSQMNTLTKRTVHVYMTTQRYLLAKVWNTDQIIFEVQKISNILVSFFNIHNILKITEVHLW